MPHRFAPGVSASDLVERNPLIINDEPWARISGETARAFAAFLAYRNLAARDRSITRAAEAHYGNRTKANVRQMQRWSAKFMWVDRALAWDDHRDAEARVAELEAIAQMNTRHITAAQGMFQAAVKRLAGLMPEELTPETLLQYLRQAVDIERRARGEPDTIRKGGEDDVTVQATFVEMTDEQLRKELIKVRLGRDGRHGSG